MKKVMIGILILIPVLILLIVAAVSTLISKVAWIAVDNIALLDKNTHSVIEQITIVLPEDSEEGSLHDFYDYIEVDVRPKRANRYSVEWRLSDEVNWEEDCMDAEYLNDYKYYLNHKNDKNIKEVLPPAMIADNDGNEVVSNTSGKFAINTYCHFSVIVQAENATAVLSVTVGGDNIASIKINNVQENDTNTMKIGQSKRVEAIYMPMTSIVTKNSWYSDNESVATVDDNGVITAHSAGIANITVEATDKIKSVTSEAYTVEVEDSLSKNIVTSKKSVALAEIGLSADDITAYNGCTRNGNIITIQNNSARITTANGELSLTLCEENDIAISHAQFFDAESGYVFAVSDLALNLNAVWADNLKEETLDEVVWTSSDASVATVNGGVVKAVSDGLVQITATKGIKSASLYLNVQSKVVLMLLRTSNDSLAVGLARETVFASEKYAEISMGNEKAPNSVLVEIVGAPLKEDAESDGEYRTRLAEFYDAYRFEVLSGKEFAVLGGDVVNRLTFVPSALDGKGIQTVSVKVSAKYPRYESTAQFTQNTVDIKVIHGVEVKNIAELRQASSDQKEYAYAEGNLVEVGEDDYLFEHINTSNGRNDRYRVYDYQSSKSAYAIAFADDIAFELNEDGTPVFMGGSDGIHLFGSLYGNNKKLTSKTNQMAKDAPHLRISWSNVTVSNLNIRVNDINEEGTINSGEASGFMGQGVLAHNNTDDRKWRLKNLCVEFCVIENAFRAYQFNNVDMYLNGNIVRNIGNVAMYVATRMNTFEQSDGIWTTMPFYSHISMNNCVYSNCLATIGSFAYERVTYMPKIEDRSNEDIGDNRYYEDYDNGRVSNGVGRFIRDDLEANKEYFIENFAKYGYNTIIDQTGFLDLYNWQDSSDANLIGDVGGSQVLATAIKTASGALIRNNSLFEKMRCFSEDNQKCYLHMGFISTGISFTHGILSEPSLIDVRLEDDRFGEPVNSRDIKKENKAGVGSFEEMLKSFEIRFYSYYTEKSDITPTSTVEINAKMIAHLHGEA